MNVHWVMGDMVGFTQDGLLALAAAMLSTEREDEMR